ncbi:hypothetical protein CDAR_509491 [Caerostris darwini]|uniref:Uncharacterized protein n=1 Tax=Caerostris darwini TaxID=1538125 RepID=A0AAV4PYK4_9ARAC|nr:hypothetical protein CDAR_509491 [Caerostris darwini]
MIRWMKKYSIRITDWRVAHYGQGYPKRLMNSAHSSNRWVARNRVFFAEKETGMRAHYGQRDPRRLMNFARESNQWVARNRAFLLRKMTLTSPPPDSWQPQVFRDTRFRYAMDR